MAQIKEKDFMEMKYSQTPHCMIIEKISDRCHVKGGIITEQEARYADNS